mgnify:CR=1 FL=1
MSYYLKDLGSSLLLIMGIFLCSVYVQNQNLWFLAGGAFCIRAYSDCIMTMINTKRSGNHYTNKEGEV